MVKRKNMFNNIYNGKKVLITGNTGFKGSWLSTWLLQLGARVYGISKDIPTQPSMFEILGLEKKIDHYWEDLRNLKPLVSIIQSIQPDFVFHLAAQPLVSLSYKEPVDTVTSNVIGTTHILEALRFLDKPCYAVIITTDKCYDNVEWEWGYKETDRLGGKDIYSGSKAAAEMIIHSYYHSFFSKEDSMVRIASVRAGNVIGGGDWASDRIVPDTIRAWVKNNPVTIRNPESTRPWQHVVEPLSGYLTLGEQLAQNSSLNGQSFNFGPITLKDYSVTNLLEQLFRNWPHEPGQKPYETGPSGSFREAGLLKLNIDKAQFHLKWLPTLTFDQVAEMTSSWYIAFYSPDQPDMYSFTTGQIRMYEQAASLLGFNWTEQ